VSSVFRAVGAIIAVIVGVSALSACGPGVNAASVATAEFAEFMSAQPNVDYAEARGSNTLPYSGTADGVVGLRDAITPEEFETIVDTVGEYSVKQQGGNVAWASMAVRIGGFSLNVDGSKATNDALRALFDAVRVVPLYTSGEVGVERVELELSGEASADALVGGLDAVNATLLAHPVSAGDSSVYFLGDDGRTAFRIEQTGRANRPDAAIAALTVLWATTALTFVEASNEEFTAHLADDAAVAAATGLVTELLANSSVVRITVIGPAG